MADDFQSSKVSANEQSSATKFNNFVQAVQDAINSLDNSNISAAAAILVSKLAPGTNGDFLQTSAGVPVWGAGPSVATYQTTLPGSPTNGQETILVDSTTAPTYAWRLRYNSAKSSNKWDFIGGAPIYSEVLASETTTSTTYAALGTAGPSIALPVAGDYFVEQGSSMGGTPGGSNAWMSYDIGGTGASDNDAVFHNVTNGGNHPANMRARKKTGLTAVTLTSKYRVTAGTGTWANRWMRVTPIAIGG